MDFMMGKEKTLGVFCEKCSKKGMKPKVFLRN